MEKRVVLIGLIVAIAAIVAVSIAYMAKFGFVTSSSQELWGQFGDYFGGVLNPIFAMLAFLAVLTTLSLQIAEFREASKMLSLQAASSSKQVELLQREKTEESILRVLEDIDSRLSHELSTQVTATGTEPVLNIRHMVREAHRIALQDLNSNSFTVFSHQVATSGSVVESSIREIVDLLDEMKVILQDYSNHEAGGYSPTIRYYAHKYYQLLDMLETLDVVDPELRQFYATISDSHG